MHILGNMIFLAVFGDNIEDRMGHWSFALFYLSGGAAATLAHALFSPISSVPLVGASGAISAVLGAYITLFPRQRVLTLLPPLILPWLVLRLFFRTPRFYAFWLPAWAYIGYWALLQVFEAVTGLGLGMPQAAEMDMSGVAWWAHVGGFVFGLVSVRLFTRPHGRHATETWPPEPPV